MLLSTPKAQFFALW